MYSIDISQYFTLDEIRNLIRIITRIPKKLSNYPLILKYTSQLLLSNSLLLGVMTSAPNKIFRGRKFNINNLNDFPPDEISSLWVSDNCTPSVI